MTTPTFIRGLRRFTARRGSPNLIVSDNAKTFKSAFKFLGELSKEQIITDFMDKHRIYWRFDLVAVRGKEDCSKG